MRLKAEYFLVYPLSGSVALTFFIFLILFTLLLIAEIRIMCRVIKNYKSQTVNI